MKTLTCQLTYKEHVRIWILREAGFKQKEISQKLRRPLPTLSNYLSAPETPTKRQGRRQKICTPL
ncbi:uncharacterized protein BDR25DRAFT_307453 [Lindgomyces ingoldianus]|uniref:Uncharacterized protein n=1 Tax=Lindgomyces ingoldianus TaxID=673940 RepID=A0ACB6QAQ4_9PLEO|nr:uncharacterized protein BDR25DRAFT_307453 [Lindgomyces ingoldianus]KAF2463976.1 hypothetical protein BDR25DRAFT_307453 [Lindgomyces ingoldianus]